MSRSKPPSPWVVCRHCGELYLDDDGETCHECGYEYCPKCVPYNSTSNDQFCPDCRPEGWKPDPPTLT